MSESEQSWRDKRKKHPWQTMLTQEEGAEIAAIEAEMAEITARRRMLAAKRNVIANRATQRCRYQNGER